MTESHKQPDKDSQPVLAYRVGQLEVQLTEGLRVINEKLDKLTYSFATKAEMQALEKQATAEHIGINAKMDEIRADLEDDIKDVQQDVVTLQKRKWAQNTLSAILGVVLTLLITYVVTDVLSK